MRKIYHRAYYAFIACLALTASLQYAGLLLPSLHSASGEIKKQPVTVSAISGTNNDKSYFDQIALMEYHINAGEKSGILQAPNRAQNLRSHFQPDLLTIESRVDVARPFKVSLVTSGVFADGHLIHAPQQTATSKVDENQLQISHSGFTEEFINSPEGIRENFIVHHAPKETRYLEVKLKAQGAAISQAPDGNLHMQYGTTGSPDGSSLSYSDLKCWDANGRILASSISFKGQEIVLHVEAENAAYPVTIDPIIAHGNPGNADKQLYGLTSRDNLGYSVQTAGDLNGDGYSEIVIGVVGWDNGIENQGAAFVYYGSGTGIEASSLVKLEGGVSDALFGYAASTAGDINGDGLGDLVIGAPHYQNGQQAEGAIFLYYGSPSGINTTASDTIESDLANAEFGKSVALAGDVNNNGFSDIIVGAPSYQNNQLREGAAFVYLGSASGLLPSPIILESDQPFAALGTAVAGAGDVNGDGYSDIIAGAPYYDDNENNEGAAFVYLGIAMGIKTVPVATLESNQAGALLGSSVASAGDYNGDGQSDVIAGAPKYDNGEGAAFLYQGIANGGVSASAKDTLGADQPGAEFGTAVASAGDVNGDGFSDLIVGAPLHSNGSSKEGAAFIYHGTATGINSHVAVLESDQDEAQMGISVASAGDVNGDGYSDVISGANLYDNAAKVDNGSAFVFHGSASGILAVPTIMLGINQSGAQFGNAVTGAGDLNGDGFTDIVVGAPQFDNGSGKEGAVFIYYGSATGVPKSFSNKLHVGQAGAQFGASVSAAGDVNGDGYGDLIVGAPYYDGASTDNGAAFVYHGSKNGISIVWNQKLESNQTNAYFGTSVAGAGDVNADGIRDVIVGAPSFDKVGCNNCGTAFVYHGTTLGVSSFYFALEGTQANAQMGFSVASAGDVNGDGYNDVIVGAPTFSNGQASEGAAFVYYGGKNGIDQNKSDVFESGDPGAWMGFSVASGGDLNGDGFSEILIGSPLFHNKPNASEGAAFIFYGSSQGTQAISLRLKGLQADAHYGAAVAGAGDVNGDGYSDMIVGAPEHDNGSPNEGMGFVYYGSANGIIPANNVSVESNFQEARMGVSVAGAGDVNGDGYSDIIIGMTNFNLESNDGGVNMSIDGGAAFVYQGNFGGNAIRNNLRVYNSNLVDNINYTQISQTNFGAGLRVKSFLGRNSARLVWETRKESIPFFSAGTITNSTNFSGQTNQYIDLGGPGTELTTLVTKVGFDNKIRARPRYSMLKALTGQIYGPWRFLPAYTQSSYTILNEPALPVTLVSFSAKPVENNVLLKWETATEENSDRFEIQGSTNGKDWKTIGTQKSHENKLTNSQYSYLDSSAWAVSKRYYRLKMIDLDETFAFSHIETVMLTKSVVANIFPNPTSGSLHLDLKEKVEEVQIFAVTGQKVHSIRNVNGITEVDLTLLPAGVYIVKFNGKSMQVVKK
nr:FG-GAP-like repeat-containing protein [uncultured Dyadobacter sp.]